MVNRITPDTARQNSARNELDASSPPNFKPQKSISANSRISEIPIVEDVIAHLANAHENRRARQVFEWERMYGAHRQNVVYR